MTARLLASFEPVPALFKPRLESPASVSKTEQRSNRASSMQPSSSMDGVPLRQTSELELISSQLLESLQQGVIVLSRSLKPLYWNARAAELCKNLPSAERPLPELPIEVSQVCYRLTRDDSTVERSLVMECFSTIGQVIRINVRWLHLTTESSRAASEPNVLGSGAHRGLHEGHASHILVRLENRDEILREELRIERKKYDLTEREAEIWMLLRQEYAYQEIASMLQISLNTVKTHVKNVYAKRRSCVNKEKFWYVD